MPSFKLDLHNSRSYAPTCLAALLVTLPACRGDEPSGESASTSDTSTTGDTTESTSDTTESTDTTDTDTTDTTDTDTTDTTDTDTVFEFTDGPTLTMAPVPDAPLAGLLEVSTNVPSTIIVHIDRGGEMIDVPFDTLTTDHSEIVLNFLPDTTHGISVTAIDEQDQMISADLDDVITAPLPVDFPTFTVATSDPTRMEPGVTLFGMSNYAIIVDEQGRVVWYFYYEPARPNDIRRLDNGNLLIWYSDRLTIAEIDMLGNVVREWHAANSTAGNPGSIPVAVDSFHHEVYMLDSGNLMTLSSELRDFANYPTGELDPTPQIDMQTVVGDVVVVFEPDGTIVSQISLFDVLDPYRIQYDSFGDYWDNFYGLTGSADWSHANAVVPDPMDGGIVLSLRNQDAVVKLDAAGQLVWILGTHDNWSPEFQPYLLQPVGVPFEWPYHQHAPQFQPDGAIVLFDNGNYRVSPPTPKPVDNYSRLVEFMVDEQTMEISQVWSYDADFMLYATVIGDADRLPVTGNTLGVFGSGIRTLREVTYDTQEVVFDLSLDAAVYRAERLPSLQP